METGEWLTRGSVWVSLTLLVAGEMVVARRPDSAGSRLGLRLNQLGFVVFLAHVACAFSFFHGWSHAAAYADTAQQTAAQFGWNSGGGLYVNYAFALVWFGELAWATAAAPSFAVRPRWITTGVRAFLYFMIFNGAVVFAHGAMRWFGLLLCAGLAWCWWPRGPRHPRG